MMLERNLELLTKHEMMRIVRGAIISSAKCGAHQVELENIEINKQVLLKIYRLEPFDCLWVASGKDDWR